jgi:hypothetical protein
VRLKVQSFLKSLRTFIYCIIAGYELDIRSSVPGRDMDVIFFLFATAPRPASGPTQPPIHRVPGNPTLEVSGRDVKLITHLHLVPRLSIRGAIPQLPQYVLMMWCLIKRYIFMAWCLVKHRDNFTFTFLRISKSCDWR